MMTADDLNAQAALGGLPGWSGMRFTLVERGRLESFMDVRADHMATNGYLHAASVITLADTTCGYGALAHLPDGASGFTTVELKSNFLGTAREGARLTCEGRLMHGGRTTQVWDATVNDAKGGRTIALFRCTQVILYR
jgi:uncharacterized protein (TIGR00369 family)